jgi:glycosidase
MTHEPDWWKRTTVYQIYPRSFADANGDGIGDLRGVIGRLDYLHDLGRRDPVALALLQSPQADFGYDISDHFGIAPSTARSTTAAGSSTRSTQRGMKVVFDMVLNHTSDEHPWFLESRSSRTAPSATTTSGATGLGKAETSPPNNWRSMLGGAAGTTTARRAVVLGELPALPARPQLPQPGGEGGHARRRAPLAREGVDGLRLDIFNALFKDASFADNPFSLRPVPSEDNPDGFFQRHLHTIDHPDTIAFARELRAVVDAAPGPPRFLVGEVFGDAETLRRNTAARPPTGSTSSSSSRP